MVEAVDFRSPLAVDHYNVRIEHITSLQPDTLTNTPVLDPVAVAHIHLHTLPDLLVVAVVSNSGEWLR